VHKYLPWEWRHQTAPKLIWSHICISNRLKCGGLHCTAFQPPYWLCVYAIGTASQRNSWHRMQVVQPDSAHFVWAPGERRGCKGGQPRDSKQATRKYEGNEVKLKIFSAVFNAEKESIRLQWNVVTCLPVFTASRPSLTVSWHWPKWQPNVSEYDGHRVKEITFARHQIFWTVATSTLRGCTKYSVHCHTQVEGPRTHLSDCLMCNFLCAWNKQNLLLSFFRRQYKMNIQVVT
jgi:hypothetical protein